MMTLRTVRGLFLGLAAAAVLAAAPLAACAEMADEANAATPEQAGDAEIQEELDQQLAERRRAMMEEAHGALGETHAALQALDEGNRKEALEALARATGKLELLVAREPELALAPVDVSFVTQDLYATPKAIRKARRRKPLP